MVFAQSNQDHITSALRELIDAGWSLGDALRELHGTRGVGLLWLVPAVMTACGLSRAEAQGASGSTTAAKSLPANRLSASLSAALLSCHAPASIAATS